MQQWFAKAARKVSNATGSPWAFAAALSSVVIWAIVGLFTGFSDTHQLIINTGTTIVTFLMVFLIQSSQNHDTQALHLKLDEVIHSLEPAREEIVGAEDMSPEELKQRLREERGNDSGDEHP